jgi:transcriptional regulator with XRE-family HTH domain
MLQIGARLRELREQKKLSQGHIEARTGLLRCYVSRVENGHTVPSLETLERFAKALEVPLYQLFYTQEQGPAVPYVLARKSLESLAKERGKAGEDARFILKVRKYLAHASEKQRGLFLEFARKLATR